MSAAWSILIVVFGGLAAIVVYVATVGGETVRGGQQLVEQMVDERSWRDGE